MQESFLDTSQRTARAKQRVKQSVTSTTADQRQLGDALTISASIRCRSLCSAVHPAASIVDPQPQWTETMQEQQFQNWMQDVSAYVMIHPVIDDVLRVTTMINNLREPIQQHLLLQVRPRHTWPEVR